MAALNSTMAERDSNSFRSILRNTTLLGGVQVFQVLINVVRGKFVAIFLGPDGMGVSSLFTASSGTIVQGSSLGLNLAIVKEVAQSTGDTSRLGTMMQLVGRVAHATALLGALFTVLFSGWLSRVTFGTPEYAWQFALLGAGVYFSVAAAAQAAVLQGLHQVKRMSQATLLGASAGLFLGVPLYWWLGTRGIVPAMVIFALSQYLFFIFQLRRFRQSTQARFNWRTARPTLRRLLSLGMVLVAGDLINRLSIYGLNIIIRTVGDIDQVGLYQAANSITAQYVGTIIGALALDYFPRLSAAAGDNRLAASIINRQTLLVVVASSALGCLIITTAPLLIRVLLTTEFLPVTDLVRIFGAGIFFKLAQFPIGYMTFAKGNRRVFLLLEGLLGNAMFFGFAAGGYMLCGLEGLGYGTIVENVLFLFIAFEVNRRLYGYTPTRRLMAEYAVAAVVCLMCMTAACTLPPTQGYIACGTLTAASALYAVWRVRRMLADENSAGMSK